MVESKNIQRSDFKIYFQGEKINIRLAVVKLWDDSSSDECSRFNVQLKLRNNEAKEYFYEDWLDGGSR